MFVVTQIGIESQPSIFTYAVAGWERMLAQTAIMDLVRTKSIYRRTEDANWKKCWEEKEFEAHLAFFKNYRTEEFTMAPVTQFDLELLYTSPPLSIVSHSNHAGHLGHLGAFVPSVAQTLKVLKQIPSQICYTLAHATPRQHHYLYAFVAMPWYQSYLKLIERIPPNLSEEEIRARFKEIIT